MMIGSKPANGPHPEHRLFYHAAGLSDKRLEFSFRAKPRRSRSRRGGNVPLEPGRLAARVRVDLSARGRARADAQGRGDDGAGSEESIGNEPSGVSGATALGGLCFCFSNLPFFGEVSEERRPWAVKREGRRAFFARLPFCLWPALGLSFRRRETIIAWLRLTGDRVWFANCGGRT